PEQTSYEFLSDDRPEDKKAQIFDPAMVHPTPVGPNGQWLLNESAAVFRLDVPAIKPDQDVGLLDLHASYAAACGKDPKVRGILPSVNMIDGKAKQFDDGLYAALDLAYYQGLKNTLRSHVDLVKHLYEKVGSTSPAAPFLAASLELAGIHVEPAEPGRKDE